MKIDYSMFNIISKEELKKITIKKGENRFFSKDTILLTHKIIKKRFYRFNKYRFKHNFQ